MIVVDTNIVVAFVLDSDQTAAAVDVHVKDPEWAAPVLWRSELRNVLAQHVRAGRLDLPTAVERMAAAVEHVVTHEQDVASNDVLRLAIDSGCSAYDCEFVALAEWLGATLVTLDRAVLRAFPERAMSPGSFTGER